MELREMRHLMILLLCVLGAFGLFACGGNSATTDKGACQAGVCVRAALNGALRLNESVPLVVTISSDTAQTGLQVSVTTNDANVQLQTPTQWTIDAAAGQTQTLTTQVKWAAESASELVTRVVLRDGSIVEYKLRAGIAQGGATLEPAATGY
jgi:hypothetical protein